MKSAP